MPLLAILFSLIFLFPPASADITSGLVGYWKLDENSGTIVADSSGNGNTGTLIGGAAWLSGYTNSDVNFDGADDMVTVADNAAFDPSIITVSAWVNPTSVTATQQIITHGNDLAGWYLEVASSTARLRFITTSIHESSSATLSVNNWQHVVVVHDGNNDYFYINGLLMQTVADTSAITNYDANLIIGQWSSGSYFWRGGIDEVRVYNRALSAGDVNQLYFCQPPSASGTDWIIDGNTTCELGTNYDQNLVGQWKFDEGRGAIAKDFSGNGNDGNLTSGPVRITNGKLGGALQFDGSDDTVTIADSSLLDITSEITVSTWVNVASQNSYKKIVVKGNSDDLTYYLSQGPSNDGASTYLGIRNASNQSAIASTLDHLPIGTWVHLVGTYNGSTIRLYWNGTEIDNTSHTGLIRTNDQKLSIGAYSNGSEYFSGSIDDVRIYNRALTATDVNNLYKDTMVARVGNNFDLRNGSLTILSSSGLELQPTKKAILRIKPTNRHQLIIQKLGKLIIRK